MELKELFDFVCASSKLKPAQGRLCISIYYQDDCEVVYYKNTSLIFCPGLMVTNNKDRSGILLHYGKIKPSSNGSDDKEMKQIHPTDAYLVIGTDGKKGIFITGSKVKNEEIFLDDDESTKERLMEMIFADAAIASKLKPESDE